MPGEGIRAPLVDPVGTLQRDARRLARRYWRHDWRVYQRRLCLGRRRGRLGGAVLRDRQPFGEEAHHVLRLQVGRLEDLHGGRHGHAGRVIGPAQGLAHARLGLGHVLGDRLPDRAVFVAGHLLDDLLDELLVVVGPQPEQGLDVVIDGGLRAGAGRVLGDSPACLEIVEVGEELRAKVGDALSRQAKPEPVPRRLGGEEQECKRSIHQTNLIERTRRQRFPNYDEPGRATQDAGPMAPPEGIVWLNRRA